MKHTLRRKLNRLKALLLAALLLAAALPWAAAAERASRTLRVAFPMVEGFSEIDENGNRRGLVVDYLNEIAKYTGWEYEYIDAETDAAVNGFLKGKYDLLGGSYYAPELEQYFAYPNYACGRVKSVLLARTDDRSIRSYDPADFKGKVIGVYERAKDNIRRLQEYLRFNDMDCTLKYYTFEDLVDGNLYPYLENGEVDLLLGNSADQRADFRIVSSFDAQSHYIVARPDDPETLAGLNMALEKIVDSNPNFAAECYALNFPESSRMDVFLNDEERAYVQKKGVVTVAVPKDFHPIYNAAHEDHKGFAIDFLERVTAFSGLQFTLMETDSYEQALALVREKKADMLGFFLGGEEQAAETGLALSQSYATLNDIVVRGKTVSYPSEGLVCAIQKGRQPPDGIVAGEVREYTDLAEALKAVNKGEVDFMIGVSARLEQVMQRYYLPNVVPTTAYNEGLDICFALPRPADTPLLTILNKSVNDLSREEKNAIVTRNTISAGANRFSLGSLIYSNPVPFMGVITLILLLAMAVVLVVARSRVRAAGMRIELERAEARSRARSDFLSRMSHEIRTPMNAVVGLADLTSMMEQVPDAVQANLVKIRSSSRYLLGLINDILDMSRIDSKMLTLAKEPFSMRRMLSDLESMMGGEAARRGLTLDTAAAITHDDLIGDAIRLRQVLTNLLSNAVKFTPAGGMVRLAVAETGADEHSATFVFRVIDSGVGIPLDDQKRIFDAFEQVGSSSARSQGTGLGLPISSSIVRMMGGELRLKSEAGHGSEFSFAVALPLGERAQEPELPAREDMFRGMRLLLAEDNELNAEIAVQLLEMQGAEMEAVSDGKAAVERFAAAASGKFQAILMDIQMPVMNGLEATRAIRALSVPDAADIPIIAMTANSFQEDIDAAMAAGMNGFVTKPLDVAYLYRVLREAIEARGGE